MARGQLQRGQRRAVHAHRRGPRADQQRALGLVEADSDSKAKSARLAMLASRTNFVLSLPMLYAMSTFQSLPA